MRIEVAGAPLSGTAPLKAYAEYRVFSALSDVADGVRTVHVSLKADDVDVICAIRANLAAGATIRVRSRCRPLSRAVDRAVRRLADVVHGRMRTVGT